MLNIAKINLAMRYIPLLLVVGVINTARGEEVGSAKEAAPRKTTSRLMEEVVVTAQKRAENIQDVPISIQAFSGDMLDAKGIDSTKDLGNITPGLVYSEAVTFSIIYLRGIGTDAFILADPSVATYVDGIYMPFGSAQSQDFGATERVEVLKGPQGTLFGRNTTGGAISITTKAPALDEGEVSVLLSQSDLKKTRARLYVSAPIGETLGVSLSGVYSKSDDYYEYTAESIKQAPLYDTKSDGIRGKILWAPKDWIELNLTGYQVNQQGGSTLITPNTAPTGLGEGAGIEAQPRDHTAELSSPHGFTNENTMFYGSLGFNFNQFDLKLFASDQYVENEGNWDFDGSNAALVYTFAPLYSDVQTSEFQILSNETSWGSDWLSWIAGLYYIQSDQGLQPLLSIGDSSDGGAFGLPLDDVLSPLVDPLVQIAPDLGNIPSLTEITVALTGALDTKSTAAFLQTTIQVNSELAITLGGRYQEEKRTVTESTSGVTANNGSQFQILNYSDLSESTTNFSPKVTIDYAFESIDTLLYASWQKGFKGGTYNIINVYDAPEYVEPEQVVAYELGFKSTFFDGALRFNAAMFRTEVENFQVQFISLANGGAVSFENAGGAVIEGADFDVMAQILPSVIDNLVVTLNGAYLNGVYTEFTDGSGFDEESGLFSNGNDFTGNETTRTPEYTAAASISKTFPFDESSLEVTVDGSYNSGYYYLAQNSDVYSEPEYYLVNGRISYFHEKSNIRLTLFGKNLNDQRYAYSQITTDFGRSESLAPPTTFGLRVQWDGGF